MNQNAVLARPPALSAFEHAVTHAVSTQVIAAARLGEQVTVHGILERRARTTASISARATVEQRTVARAQLTKTVIQAR